MPTVEGDEEKEDAESFLDGKAEFSKNVGHFQCGQFANESSAEVDFKDSL